MLNTNQLSPYVRAAILSTLRPGLQIKERALFDYELIWLKEGSFQLSMYGKNYEIKQNDIILIPPGVNHVISVPADAQPPLHAHIHFDCMYSEYSPLAYVSYKNLHEFSSDEILMIQPDFFDGDIPFPFFEISNRKKLTASINEVIKLCHTKPALYQLACKEILTGILRSIMLDNVGELNTLSDSEMDFISSIKSFVDANYLNGKISLDMIADQFHYSKFYVAKRFQAAYGVSLIKYCNSLRLEFAKDKLSEGLAPSRVAELLFFPDVYSFSRFFRIQSGLSPSAYLDSLTKRIKADANHEEA